MSEENLVLLKELQNELDEAKAKVTAIENKITAYGLCGLRIALSGFTCYNCSHCSATATWCNKLDIEVDWDLTCGYWKNEEEE